MIRFNSRKTKPSVFNIAILSVILIAAIVYLTAFQKADGFLLGIVFVIFFGLVIVFLIDAVIKQLQYNPYSYNTIYYSGFAVFVSYLFLSILIFLFRYEYYLEYADPLASLISSILYSGQSYMILTSPFVFVFSLLLTISNIFLFKYEGRSLSNTLGIILSVMLVGGIVYMFITNFYVSGSHYEVMIHDVIMNILSAIYLYFESMLIGTIIANAIVVRYKCDYDADFIIILGCGLRKDGTPLPLLAARIEKALDFYNKQLNKTGKNAKFISSGGKGEDEIISESQSMKNYLIQKGVKEENILMEDKSTNTYENMYNSKQIIDSINPDGNIIFSTNGFHVFRSGLMARRVKMKAIGIAAKTKWYFWPNASVREFVGLLTKHKTKQIIVITSMIVIYGLATLYIFLSNIY